MTTREQIIEAMARAMCEADGDNPDDPVVMRGGTTKGVYWKHFYQHVAEAALDAALPQIAEVVQDRGPATQDTTSTLICEALDGAAAALRALGKQP